MRPENEWIGVFLLASFRESGLGLNRGQLVRERLFHTYSHFAEFSGSTDNAALKRAQNFVE
jgi:hypothetical protein